MVNGRGDGGAVSGNKVAGKVMCRRSTEEYDNRLKNMKSTSKTAV